MEISEKIKQAIEIEIKHQYINIRGKNRNFSHFMKDEIRKIYKESKKNPKWSIMLEAFEHYATDTMPGRRKTIARFLKVLQDEKLAENEKNTTESKSEKSPSQTDVTYIKGVGPKVGYILNKLGIFTASDLMFYFPRKHVDYSGRTLIKNLVEGTNTTIFGTIKSVSNFTSKKNLNITKVKIADESGSIELNFFQANSNRYIAERTKSRFPQNASIMLSGTVKLDSYTGKFTIDKPTFSIISDEVEINNNLNMNRIVPVYQLGDNINHKVFRKAVYNAIQMFKNDIANVIPQYLIEKHGLMDKKDSVSQIHFPDSNENLDRARFSLIYEELFLIQLRMAHLREQNRKNNTAIPLKVKPDGLVMNFIKNLPFELTDAQKNAVQEILKDMNSEEQMQRLLQGDVGSGKTVVACIMLLAAVENGYQGAIMAPTEILAQQHYNNFKNWLEPLNLNVGLFLGSNNKKTREKFESELSSGKIDIATGTHALIQDNIRFSNLGAIVIDEQHRFGVKQRTRLKTKAQSPQMLTMTATPIPRTLALTLHGDLDLTLIDEMPKGRKPVKTLMCRHHREVYELIKSEVEKKHQAYIVYPLIEESETLSAKAATIEAERLAEQVFPNLKIGLLHGKLKNAEKEKVMADFKNKKYDILVSTTVVEVGVDVPNATVMLIENAERFGLSQLHQLRGRVGRSEIQSYCILSTSSKSIETLERLNIMCESNNGFVIAEKDLQIRGPGEFLGVRQSGIPDLVISDLVRDAKILEIAREDALEFVKTQNIDEFPALKNLNNLQLLSDYDILRSG